ncbi:uncharacterized protein LOC127094827 [Lathyrus oleraceus]|uniref:uncharacterized protein LOC127094827 n=1 Tax=Pisum sativum TaxID=3888 RepID=UPI0021D08EBF|nr:uncharacterized protein LOC127094827 [Pisum sativum]
MVGSTSTGFSELVMAEERIEAGLKMGKILLANTGSSSSGIGKNPFSRYPKKMEGESSVVYAQRGRGRPQHQQQHQQQYQHQHQQQQVNVMDILVAATYQPQEPQYQQQQQQNTPRRNYNHPIQPKIEKVFNPLPMSYSRVLQHLLQLKLVNLRGMPPPPERLHAGYNPNARCEFHSGGIGHDLENCWALKYKMQELLDSKAIQFTPDNGPNVIQNPKLDHVGPTVIVMDDGENLNLIMDVNLLSTPFLCVKSYLINNGVFPICFLECCFLQCDRIVKDEKVEEKDVAIISIPHTPTNIPTPARPTPLTIMLPGPLPYSSKSVVPWNYGSDVYYHVVPWNYGLDVYYHVPSEYKPSEDESLNVDNFVGTGRITISGRIYSPQNAQYNIDALEKAKGKQVVGNNSESVSANAPNAVPGTSSSQEVEELLRLIRKSDYKVIDHLSQTPSKISILSLLLCSEAHRNVLGKLLSSSFVPQNITVNQLEWVVASISADNGLGFTELDLPLKGCNHKNLCTSL